MTTLTRAPISKSELIRLSLLPEYAGSKLELWDGDLYVLKPSPAEARLKARLLRLLRELYRAQPIGYVLQDASIDLPGEMTILKPALSVITAQQHGYDWDSTIKIMPRCIVEIATDGESMRHLHAKLAYYESFGCALPIAIDPCARSVDVMTAIGIQSLHMRDVLDARMVLPGFRIPVWRLFVSN